VTICGGKALRFGQRIGSGGVWLATGMAQTGGGSGGELVQGRQKRTVNFASKLR